MIALGAAHAIHGTNHRGGRGRGGDHAIDLRRPDAHGGPGDALANVVLHARQLARVRGIALEKQLGQADRSERLRKGVGDVPALRQNDFAAAPADVDDQDALLGMRPLALHAQMHEPRFFQAGNDFDRRSQNGGGARQKLGLISGIAQRGGSHGAHGEQIQLAELADHHFERAAGRIHGRFAQPPVAKDAGAQAHHLALRRERDHFPRRIDLRRQHADGVAADIDRRVS